MARVFISHSSRDNDSAGRIKHWLHEQGFETPFLDYDKHAGIPPGADWEQTLYREITLSEAVVIIQTPNWLESKWCFAEFTQARALGKPIFPIIETPDGDTLISPDIQALDLRKDRDGGLEQLSRQLTQLALDAQGGFAWDSTRPPYPGLLAFQEEDAPLYFGRDDDIRRLIERLNARRAQGGTKLVALLGASGSGKSSLMRAGVIPRLKRSGRNWIVLPPMRPQVRPVDELARSLAVALGDGSDWRTIRKQLNGDGPSVALHDIVSDLRVRAKANEAQILLTVDQAEELFGAADVVQARRFFEILNVMLSDEQSFIIVMAMRSDFLGLLQSAEGLTTRFEEFSLGPMPMARIPQIIEGPARVAGLGIDEALIHQAARDAQTEDALPLLAFALRELYDRSSDDNYLSLEEYKALGDEAGGLTPLDNAVRKAADNVLAMADPSQNELTALQEAFVPSMVRVNDQGEYIRRPARWDDLPANAHRLLESLAKARLLVISQEADERMVEVAHEALLRKWPRLRAWLDNAREFLIGKQQMEIDLRDWERAQDADKSGALLTGPKLARARGWLLERAHQLGANESAFVQASVEHADAAEQRKVRFRRNLTWASLSAAMLLAVAAGFAGWQWLETQKAFENRAVELIRYTWSDLGEKQQDSTRLATVVEALGLENSWNSEQSETAELRGDWKLFFPVGVPEVDWSNENAEQLQKQRWLMHEDLIPSIICKSADCVETKLQADGFDCQTYLTSGFRHLYCSVRNVISFEKLQSIAGLAIFRPDGPHDNELNFNEAFTFGHYNPAFLDWLEKYIVPQAQDDARFNALTQLVYRTQIGPLARALYHSHEILFADNNATQVFEERYRTVGSDYSGPELRFQSAPVQFEKIRTAYLRRLENRIEVNSDSVELGNDLGEDFRWLSDYLATDKADDWYLANTAGGFWVRRSIDGSAPQIFQLLEKLLKTFEPTVLES